uniref:Conjugal transfer protein TraH n=1 Tax=Ascaris lumbricoides TaxID=6252 RepID=A0A0M3HFU3_ASCLU
MKGTTIQSSDAAMRDQRIDEVLSRIDQLSDNNVFCETCHRMRERNHSGNSIREKVNDFSYSFINVTI